MSAAGAHADRDAAGTPHARPRNALWARLAVGVETPVAAPWESSPRAHADEREADEVAERVLRAPASAAREEGRERGTGADATAKGGAFGALAGGRALPRSERDFFEPRLGMDLGHVRIHTTPSAERMASRFDARAFTYGNHVAFAPGEYREGAGASRRLLAHELVHVRQQASTPARVARQGASRPSTTPTIPWNERQISAGVFGPTCGAEANSRDEYFVGDPDARPGGPYGEECPSPCAHRRLPLSIGFWVDLAPPGAPRPAPFEPARIAATVTFIPDSGGAESVLVQGQGRGTYVAPGHPLAASFPTDLKFFSPPESGTLLVSLIHSDPTSGQAAFYRDLIPVVDCPREKGPRETREKGSTRARAMGAVELGRWLVVKDPNRDPYDFEPLDQHHTFDQPGEIVSVWQDDNGYFYRYQGRIVRLRRWPF